MILSFKVATETLVKVLIIILIYFTVQPNKPKRIKKQSYNLSKVYKYFGGIVKLFNQQRENIILSVEA